MFTGLGDDSCQPACCCFCRQQPQMLTVADIAVSRKVEKYSSSTYFGVFSSSTLNFISELGCRIRVQSAYVREGSFLFRVSDGRSALQFIAFAWPSYLTNSIQHFLFLTSVFNPGYLYYLVYNNFFKYQSYSKTKL